MILDTMTAMDPLIWLLIGAAGGAGAVAGALTRRRLAALSYRIGEEASLDDPGRRRWVVWITAGAWLSLALKAAITPETAILMLPLIPLAVTGPWLAGVDFDVFRLPNRVIVPTLIATAALVAVVALLGHIAVAITAAIGMLAVAGMLAVLHFITNQVGFGDVKLAAILGLALGTRTMASPLVAVILGSIAAIIWTRATKHQGPLPYGPWLLFGAWVAALV
jgi:leader peptidase (prepilin peptidase)/N-methyltransferase